MFSCCMCCKPNKSQKNDLLGLEGMVKLKNPDEVFATATVGQSESQGDLNTSTISNADSEKRASTAAHRSLPDIPITEANGDTGSELYETVAEKHLIEQQNNLNHGSPTTNLKKQVSVSQHSSISQADDISSPYSRVKNSPHGYAKVRSTEHPYAQVNPPSTSNGIATANSSGGGGGAGANVNGTSLNNSRAGASSRCSQHQNGSTQDLTDSNVSQVEIPAASAIAGMISASQDLPYMTPPISNQHFSGDSQDSSKGYTSISVREPLANILGQQPIAKPTLAHNTAVSRDVNDSHYATVSDDSDETYAAIEDPNLRNNLNTTADIYTSGSETYAQIQPMQSFVVSVEINNSSHIESTSEPANINLPNISSSTNPQQTHAVLQHVTPIPPPVDSLRAAQMHTRQASSSSNNSSSVGNLGSPKPEKRQANSPLPPTPKSATSTTLNITTNQHNTPTSGRNSVVSVLDFGSNVGSIVVNSNTVDTNAPIASNDSSPLKKSNKSLSPSKDIENMYAKVMKKNKFSTRNSPPSLNNSPVLTRKFHEQKGSTTSTLGISPLDATAAEILDSHKISVTSGASTKVPNESSRTRSNSYGAKDHGYETIPADVNRKSDGYAHILQKERHLEGNKVGSNLTTASSTVTTALVGFSPNSESRPIVPEVSTITGSKPQQHGAARISASSYQSQEKHYETIPAGDGDGDGDMSEHNTSDPGYETLSKTMKHQTDADIEKRSDYDPNYEILRGPNNQNSSGLSDDGYAKVVEKKQSNAEDDSVDGYSKVKGEETEDGYSTIREYKEKEDDSLRADDNHNYASISETKGSVIDAHSLKPHQNLSAEHLSAINMAASTPVRGLGESISVDSLRHKSRPTELIAIASPTSLNSSSLLNNNSSANSTTNMTTTSTRSTFSSSRQTPSSSQYESLTGSDTDPNYESVSYLQTTTATRSSNEEVNHPYEQLLSATTPEILSPRTPSPTDRDRSSSTNSLDGQGGQRTTTVTVLTAKVGSVTTVKTSVKNASVEHRSTLVNNINSSSELVDDYFQV